MSGAVVPRQAACHCGFTLLELAVVVAVVGLLATIAVPSYHASVLKGRRAEARVALLELLQSQERYATQTNCYLAFSTTPDGVSSPGAACTDHTGTTVPFKNFSGDSWAGAHYLLWASVCTGRGIQDCVVVHATPRSADPEAGTLSISSAGEKSCSGTVPARCWR